MPRKRVETEQAREEALRVLAGEGDRMHMYSSSRRAWQLIDDVGWDWQDPASTDEELLAALTLVDLVREQADEAEERLLRALRRDVDPVTWSRIADAMGVTRQGAERRYLRATSSGRRYAEEGRRDQAQRRKAEQEALRRTRERWGRTDPAARDWRLRLRVRTYEGKEIEAQVHGKAGEVPKLRTVLLEDHERGAGVTTLSMVTALAVTAETTPWEDVDPPTDPLAGLPTG